MRPTRRKWLIGASAFAILAGLPKTSNAFWHGSASGFNGGLTQVNTANAQAAGAFVFMNFMKSAQEWSYSGAPSSGPPQPILELDANGYPTSIVAGTSGVFTVIVMPGPTEESGNWVLDWVGTGTLNASGLPNTPISGSLTGTNGQYVFSLQAGGTFSISILATNAAPNNVQNVRLYRQVDQTALNNGAIFFPPHIAIMKSAKPGVIRSLGWGGGFNGTNDASTTTWATRKPTTYYTYEGGVYNPAWWPGGTGTTTNSGSDYTLAYSGFTLTNKVVVQLLWNANTPQSASTTVTYTNTSGSPIQIVWTAHGLSANNAVALGTGLPAALTSATTYYIKTVVDANTFTVSATRGGTAINAADNLSGSCPACSIPMININSTGFVGVTGLTTPRPDDIFVGFNTQLPQTGRIYTIVYDSTIGYFWLDLNGVFTNGAPPEVFAAYCAAVGSHPHIVSPYLSMEPLTDYMTSWVTYIKNTYPWMKPRVEPPNECWNLSPAFRGSYYAQSLSYALWSSQADVNNAYGKWCSVLGQAISAIYGNDRTKYSMICSVFTSGFYSGVPVGTPSQNDRLVSTKYVSVNGGDPAYKWVDRVCAANYYSPAERYTCQELIDAYAYSVTDAGNAPAQAILANNYAATSNSGNTPFTMSYVFQCFTNLKSWAQGMPAGNTVAGMTCYEGGYSPDYLAGNWSTNITGATKANPCVLTLASTSQNSEQSGMTGNPAVIGMSVTPSGIVGMTQLNGNTYTVTAVSGNLVTINVDSSAFTAYSSGGLATYVNSMTYSNTFRTAGANSTQGGVMNTLMYTDFAALASSGFVAEYPSNFVYFGSGSVWPVLQPDIYAPLTPQWNSIVSEN